MTRPIRLVLVDDHPLFAQSLRDLLAFPDNLDVVGVTDSAGKALIQIGPLAPGVVLIDLQMPGLDGVAATRRIAARHPATAVLALTMYDDDASVSAILPALEAGLAG
jgi:DNA-binding NarL/FixJ family response regulator